MIGVPEEDKKKGHEKLLEEIIVENFPEMGKKIATQVQEIQRVPNRINPRWSTPGHILIKLTKIKHKEQILKEARGKQQMKHKVSPIRKTADLSIETLYIRREWQDIKWWKGKKQKQKQKTITKFTLPRDLTQICRRNQKLYRQSKTDRKAKKKKKDSAPPKQLFNKC